MKTILLALAPALIIPLTGCDNNPETAPAPPPAKRPAAAPLTQAPVSFQDNVATVLAQRCADCHIEDSKGGLNATTFAAFMKGGTNGPVVVPGRPDESLLVKLIESDKMPKRGRPLSDELKQDIREWVEKGARFDGPAEDAKLLSYVMVQEEGGMGGQGESGRRGGGWDPVVRFDKDDDGKLSKEEVPEQMKDRFDTMDANKDGFLTTAEFRAGMQGRFGGGRSRGGERGGGERRPGEGTPQRPAFDGK